MLRTLRGFKLRLHPACRFLDQEDLDCDEMGPNRLQKETKQKKQTKTLGHPSRGYGANNIGQVAFSAVG